MNNNKYIYSDNFKENMEQKITCFICKKCGMIYTSNETYCWATQDCNGQINQSIEISVGSMLANSIQNISDDVLIEFLLRQIILVTARKSKPYIRCNDITVKNIIQFIKNNYNNHIFRETNDE